MEQFEAEANHPVIAADERALCGCLRKLLPTLKPEYAEAVDRIELQQKPIESVAKELGISPSNLRVRLHRGRKQLQERLQETCRVCAKHGCLDCTCSSRE